MIKKLRNSRAIRKFSGLAAILGMLSFGGAGCEDDSNSSEASYNSGQGRDNISVSLGGHMYDGDSIKRTIDVYPNTSYEAYMICSNDGDSDTINIYADNNKIGEYSTEENRFNGNGWYVDQTAGPYSFTTSSNTCVLEVTTETDSWGTWPKSLHISKK